VGQGRADVCCAERLGHLGWMVALGCASRMGMCTERVYGEGRPIRRGQAHPDNASAVVAQQALGIWTVLVWHSGC
jgi:hypothetical protein